MGSRISRETVILKPTDNAIERKFPLINLVLLWKSWSEGNLEPTTHGHINPKGCYVSFNKEPNVRHPHALDQRWKRRSMNPQLSSPKPPFVTG